jgi:L-fuconolactonase
LSFPFGLASCGNVHLKLTPNSVRASTKGKAMPETFFSRLVKEFGPSRIAWGSNYPASPGTLPEIVTEAKTVLGVLPPQDQEWIFSRTPQTLYPALADK